VIVPRGEDAFSRVLHQSPLGQKGPRGSITHISGRYADEEILAEATKTFPNTRLAMDFDHIVV
jgi:hypothetical protein